MILSGIYQNGFAPRDGEPLFPELWRGCVGAWNPGLGPSGLRLYDWSGRGNHGTLTNMPAADGWRGEQGRYALDFSFVSGGRYVTIPNTGQLNLGPRDFSVQGWARPTVGGSSVGRDVISCYFAPTSPFASYGIELQSTVGGANWAFFCGVSGNVFVRLDSSQSASLNTWQHIAGTYSSAGMRLYVDGILVASNVENRDVIYNNQPVTIGQWPGSFETNQQFNGQIADTAVWRRVLHPNEIRLLASRRGIAYEMAPRSWSAQQIAAYRARYYSQVIGSGVI
jgi:hypothetical protein